MRAAAVLPLVLAAGIPAGAMGASVSADEVAAAVQGCWGRVNWPERGADSDPLAYASYQLCFDGGLEGNAKAVECFGAANIECREILASYELGDEKFWLDYGDEGVDGQLSQCDVRLGPGERLELFNCEWVVPTSYSTAIPDMVFEKAGAR